MYEYHGWLSTFEILDAVHLLTELKNINSSHPVSAQYVNGKLHISFSGFPNRNSGQVAKMVDYLCRLNGKLSGCIYK